MTPTEIFAMVAMIIALLSLVVSIVHTTFDITWKISHERKDNDSKKANDRQGSQPIGRSLFCVMHW